MGQEHSSPSTCDRRPRAAHPPVPPPKPNSRSSICSGYTTTASTDTRRSNYTTKTSSRNSSTDSDYKKSIYSNKSSKTDKSDCEYRRPIYTNVHYKDLNNNDLYKPLKLSKSKIHRLKILNSDKETADYLEKHLSIKSYLEQDEVKKKNAGPQLPEPTTQKKAGIRNYTPKILSEKNPQKDLEHWI